MLGRFPLKLNWQVVAIVAVALGLCLSHHGDLVARAAGVVLVLLIRSLMRGR
jgi:hypothetical protein